MNSLKDILGGGDFIKRTLQRRFPKLKNQNFEVKQEPKTCVECNQDNLITYSIKLEGQDEWRLVPESDEQVCIKCEDKKNAREAYAQHKQIKYRYLWQLTNELKGATLDVYKADNQHTIKALKAAREYVEDFRKGDKYNLLWIGSYGVGKSHLSKCIAETIKLDGMTVGFISVDALLDMIKNTFNEKTGRSEFEIKNDLKALDLLVLDELGTDDQKSEWARGTINEIINSRNGKPTIYTTNLTTDELDKVLDGRTVDRIHQNTKIVEVYTKSYRRQQTR